MKTLTVRVTAELQVPDDWTLVDHAAGMTALKIGDQFVDFDIAHWRDVGFGLARLDRYVTPALVAGDHADAD